VPRNSPSQTECMKVPFKVIVGRSQAVGNWGA